MADFARSSNLMRPLACEITTPDEERIKGLCGAKPQKLHWTNAGGFGESTIDYAPTLGSRSVQSAPLIVTIYKHHYFVHYVMHHKRPFMIRSCWSSRMGCRSDVSQSQQNVFCTYLSSPSSAFASF